MQFPATCNVRTQYNTLRQFEYTHLNYNKNISIQRSSYRPLEHRKDKYIIIHPLKLKTSHGERVPQKIVQTIFYNAFAIWDAKL